MKSIHQCYECPHCKTENIHQWFIGGTTSMLVKCYTCKKLYVAASVRPVAKVTRLNDEIEDLYK